MIKQHCVIGIIAFIACSSPLRSQAQEPTDEPITVAFSELIPWKTIEGNHYRGVYAEILREMANGLGKELHFQLCPLKRCLLMMKTGTADWIIGVKDTNERKNWIQFLKTPYRHTATKSFYVRKGNRALLQRYEDLYTLRVGVKKGARYFKPFDQDKNIQKQEVNSDKHNFEKLLSGRIDTFPINSEVGAIMLPGSAYQDKVERAEYSHTTTGLRSIGVSKQSKHLHLLDQMDDLMKKMVESGKLDALYQEHFFKRYGVSENFYHWR